MSKTVAKYQRYAEYKDSGIVWMGNVPKHWTSERFKWSLTEKLKTSNPNLPAGSISFGEVIYKNEENLSSDTKASYQEVLKDEFLINPLNLNYDLKSLRTALSKIDVVVSTGYIVLHCNHLLDRNYVRWLLQEFDVAHMKTLGAGVRQTVNFSDIANCYFYLPEQLEQRKIAHFLDHETAKIDSLIEKQQQLIQLLKEKRQAVISHAVTKGLNPDVAMKDSGVEWLGEVPEHWDTTKIKYVAELTPKKSEVSSNDNRLCTFVPMEKLKLGSLIKDEEKPISEVIGGYTYFKNGDLLLAKVTPCFENKNMVVASDLKNGIGFGSSEIYVLRTNHKVNTQFLYYRLQEDQFMELGTGAMTGAGGLKRVPSEFLNNFEFALPPLSEQIAITKYLNQYLIKNEYLMNKAQSAIQLMQERRTALISAAVTGKIDVRNWQNPNKNNEAKTEFRA